jgi:hypothetical protein
VTSKYICPFGKIKFSDIGLATTNVDTWGRGEREKTEHTFPQVLLKETEGLREACSNLRVRNQAACS